MKKNMFLSAFALWFAAAAILSAAENLFPEFPKWQNLGANVTTEPADDENLQGVAVLGASASRVEISYPLTLVPGKAYRFSIRGESRGANDNFDLGFRIAGNKDGQSVIVFDGGFYKHGTLLTRSEKIQIPADGPETYTASLYADRLTAGAIAFDLAKLFAIVTESPTGRGVPLPERVGGIIFNEDSTQFLVTQTLKPNDETAIRNYIRDNYLPGGHQVRAVAIDPQAAVAAPDSPLFPDFMKHVQVNEDGSVLYRGKAQGAGMARLVRNVILLRQTGVDYHKVWIDELRKHQVSPIISIRMNDMHSADNPEAWCHVPIWREHPEWRIATYRTDDSGLRGLDFARQEVRDYKLQCIKALTEPYDLDGIELDYMRFGRVFAPGKEHLGRPLLTGFMRDIRAFADELGRKKGRRLTISVRVPVTSQESFENGFDVEAWAKEGLVDMVTPSTFFDTSANDIPIRDWRRIVGKEVLIAPCIEANFSPFYLHGKDRFGSKPDFEFGLASVFLAQGADRIYFFNHFHDQTEVAQKAGLLETAAAPTRRVPLLYNDFTAVGSAATNYLPKSMTASGWRWASFRLKTGPRPEESRHCLLIIGIAGETADALLGGEVRLNGTVLTAAKRTPRIPFPPHADEYVAFEVSPALLNDGEDNCIEVRNSPKRPFTINWLEVNIDAL